MTPIATVIIPAFEGAATLGRSLGSLAAQALPSKASRGDIHVIVAVNDGREDTLKTALAYESMLDARGYRCSVISGPAGRRAAFGAAEALAGGDDHRIYLDQDARLSPGALSALIECFERKAGVEFATLRPRFERSDSALVRAFSRAWERLPYVSASPVTMGLFAVSAQGRRRWGDWPRLGADDKFVRLLFRPHERALLGQETYHVLPPRNLAELCAARRRYWGTNAELVRHGVNDDVPRLSGLRRAFANPLSWPDLAVLSGVVGSVAVAALLARGR